MRVRNPSSAPTNYVSDELISAVLLDMRVGTFAEGNKNLFKRYSFDIFRCHVCNHVLPTGSHAPHTTAHLSLHRMQVRAVLNENYRNHPDWSFTNEPTKEEVVQADSILEYRAAVAESKAGALRR